VEFSLEPKFTASANRRLIGSPKLILVSFLSVFPIFFPMNSFFHFIQFQFKMKKMNKQLNIFIVNPNLKIFIYLFIFCLE